MNQVVTELTIDARGAEAGSTTYVRAMQVAQAAVDRVIERSRTLSAASEENSARMLGTSTSVARAAAAFDRLKASIDPTHASALAMQKDILVLDRAVTTLGVSETESARIMDQLVLKHDAVAQSVRRRAQEYASLRSAEAGAAFNMDVNRSFGIGNQPKSARDSMTAFTAADNETALYQRRLSEVRAEVDPLAAAVGRLNSELAEYQVMMMRGDLSAEQFAKAQVVARDRVSQLQYQIERQGRLRDSGGNIMASINAGQQLQDILITSMMNQPIGTIALQQGTQLGSAAMMMNQGGEKVGLLKTMGMAAKELINPVMLGAVAFTGLTAAALQYFTSSKRESKSFDELMKQHNTAIQKTSLLWGEAAESRSKYGRQTIGAVRLGLEGSTIDMAKKIREGAEPGWFGAGEIQSGIKSAFDDNLKLTGMTSNQLNTSEIYRTMRVDLQELYRTLGNNDEKPTLKLIENIERLGAASQNVGIKAIARDALAALDPFRQLAEAIRDSKRELDRLFNDRGPGGLLLSHGPTNTKDMDSYAKYLAQERVTADRQRAAFDAEMQSMRAKSPIEKADAAKAQASATFDPNESASARRQRIELAGLRALEQANHDLGQAQEDRFRSYGRTIASAQMELSLIGQSTASVEARRQAFELEQQLREEAARNNIPVDEAEIARITRMATEYGKLAALQQARTELSESRDQLAIQRAEVDLVGAPNSVRERTIAMMETEQRIRKLGIPLYGLESQAMRAATQARVEYNEEQKRKQLLDDAMFERSQLGRTANEQEIASRLRGTGYGMNSLEARTLRENQVLSRQVQIWKDIREAGKETASTLLDLPFNKFKDWKDILESSATDIAKLMYDLNVKNPLINMAYSDSNLPTAQQAGGLGGFVSTFLGLSKNPAAKFAQEADRQVATMSVRATMVSVNGDFGGLGGLPEMAGNQSGAGIFEKLFGVRTGANAIQIPAAAQAAAGFLPGGGAIAAGLSQIGGKSPYSVANATDFIRQYAAQIGIDPNIALRVARSEGLQRDVWQANYVKDGFREPSFGPFQLLKGGKGTGFTTGMGNDFMAATGLDPADPANWRESTAFALQQAKQKGWGAWYGAKGQGITGFEGIDRSAPTPAYTEIVQQSKSAATALEKLATATPDATSGVLDFAKMFQQGGSGLSSFLGSPDFRPNMTAAQFFGAGGAAPAPQAGGTGGGGFMSLLMQLLGSFIPGFADGTEGAPAGWAWVGENGRELRKLRGGDVIRSNSRSEQMAADYARGGGGFSVKNETHIHNNAGVQVTEERSDDGNGNTRTDITIERVVAGAITRQGGAPNRALKALGVGTGPRISRG